MLTQLATKIVLSILLYHATRTFQFINTSPLQEYTFALKDMKSLKTLPSNSTNIMCSSIIDKYIKRPNYLSNVSFIEFVTNHDMANVNKKRHKSHIIHYVHYNEHCDPKNFYNEKLLLFILFFHNENTFKGHYSTWYNAYNMHEKEFNAKKIICRFHNDNTHMMHWANIESQPRELATTYDTNISMTIFFDANVHFPPQEIINCTG
jgi:hypothetical protein